MTKKYSGWIILFALLLFGAYAYRIVSGGDASMAPFGELSRITELGYKVILLGFAEKAVPFIAVGLFLSPAFLRIDRIYKALIAGAIVGAMLFLTKLFASDVSADSTEAILAALGITIGFCLYAIIESLVKKKDKVRLSKRTGISSAVVVLAAYLFCMAVLFIDNGSDFVPLNLFVPDQALPQDITCSANLEKSPRKAMTYKSVRLNPDDEVSRLSKLLGISGEIVTQEDASVLNAQGRELTVFANGNWSYFDDAASSANAGKPLLDDAAALKKANEYVSKLTTGLNEIRQVSLERVEDQGVSTVQYETYVNGYRVRGSGEYTLDIGANGDLVSFQKLSPDFKEYHKVGVISARTAFSRIKKGGVAHTLFEPAKSAVLTGCTLAYWQEEVKGYLQPIWLFSGIATLETGEQKSFEIFIPAMN